MGRIASVPRVVIVVSSYEARKKLEEELSYTALFQSTIILHGHVEVSSAMTGFMLKIKKRFKMAAPLDMAEVYNCIKIKPLPVPRLQLKWSLYRPVPHWSFPKGRNGQDRAVDSVRSRL